jgi:hypothetical protein
MNKNEIRKAMETIKAFCEANDCEKCPLYHPERLFSKIDCAEKIPADWEVK